MGIEPVLFVDLWYGTDSTFRPERAPGANRPIIIRIAGPS